MQLYIIIYVYTHYIYTYTYIYKYMDRYVMGLQASLCSNLHPPPWHHGAGLPAPAEGVPTAFTCMSYNVLLPNSSWDRGKNGDEDLHPVQNVQIHQCNVINLRINHPHHQKCLVTIPKWQVYYWVSHINGIQNEKREREDIPAGFLVGVFKSKAGMDFRSSKKTQRSCSYPHPETLGKVRKSVCSACLHLDVSGPPNL